MEATIWIDRSIDDEPPVAALACRCRRSGMVLYAVLGLSMLLAVFLFAYFSFVRSQTRMARRIMASETAYQVARAGIVAGIAWFENTREECPLKRLLVDSPVSAVNGREERLDVSSHGPLQALLAEYGEKVSLDVTLSLHGFRPLVNIPRSASGVVYDQVEKLGILRVRAEADYDGSRRVLVAQKQVKVVALLPYVVSKFTLFARELYSLGGATARNNHLDRARLVRQSFDRARLDSSGPDGYGLLRLFNGSASDIEDRGWIFLGSSSPRYLNLAYGRGDDGEEHHLLARPWELSGSSGVLEPGFTIKFIQKGFFSGIKADNDLFDHFPFGSPPSDPIEDRASLLQLFGSAVRPSATIALGRLYRRFLVLRYVRKVATNQHVSLPFCPASAFGPPPGPWSSPQAFDPVSEAFAGQYHRYAMCMSFIQEEPYNRSVDFIENPSYPGMSPPRVLQNPDRLSHRTGVSGFLYQPADNDGHIELKTASGALLFSGGLADMRSGDLLIESRATYAVPASAFPAFLASRPKRIPGIVLFRGGGITVDRPLELVDGGMICSDGDVVISARVGVAAGGRPLALVSLGGNIVIKTDERIGASLVALEGGLGKPAGLGVRICGNLVLGRLDAESLLKGGGDIVVEYDESLDPTGGTGMCYGVFASPERSYYQE